MKVVWTEQAFERLKEIKDYIMAYGGSSLNANRLVKKLIERRDSLSVFHQRGRIVDEPGQEDIRELVEKNYRIVYRIRLSKVEILTVFEAHRLLRNDKLDLPDQERMASGGVNYIPGIDDQ
ncbi:MAG: toxin, RelE family [Alphaproteobacteria bacterium]|jgi:addiction module RelE/StbE family toxin|nr:toxin, RelE family [Alphaproteobacteria bacterium]